MGVRRQVRVLAVLAVLPLLLTGVIASLVGPAVADDAPASPVITLLGGNNATLTAGPFVGEELFAQSQNAYDVGDPQSTAWTCSVDFGDGTAPSGYWRSRFDPAPCAMYHTYDAPGRYTITMTVTDPTGATSTSQRDVRVTTRRTTAVDGGVEGSPVRLAGPGGDAAVTWQIVGDPSGSPYYVCQLFDTSAAGATLRCANQGTYQVRYDGPTAATSGEYDVTFVNGAPQPTLVPTRTAGIRPGVPSLRVGTGDRVLWSAVGHDPSFYPGSLSGGDPESCTFDFGNGSTQSGSDYLGDTCGGSTVYDRPGVYTATVTVTDDSGASGTATQRITVVRRDVTVRVSGQQADGLRGRIVATLGPSGVGGTVSFVLPGGKRLTGQVTDLEVYDRRVVGVSGPATVGGHGGLTFYAELYRTGSQSMLLTAGRRSHERVYEQTQRADFATSFDVPYIH